MADAQKIDYAQLELDRAKAVEQATQRIRENLPTYRSFVDPERPNDSVQERMGGAVRATWMHGDQYRPIIDEYAKKKGVDPTLVHALLSAEQQGNMTPGDYSKKSKAGAEGLMQIMPATAQRWNINVNDPRDSIRGAVDVVAELQTRLGTTDPLFLAASYNAGDKAVRGYAQATSDLPAETKKYLAAVDLAYLALSDPNRGKNP